MGWKPPPDDGINLPEWSVTPRLVAPQFVGPHVKINKNDAADAEAIREAVSRPSMRFVPIKNVEKQAVIALHRVRHGSSMLAQRRPTTSEGCWANTGWW
jgi:transposase